MIDLPIYKIKIQRLTVQNLSVVSPNTESSDVCHLFWDLFSIAVLLSPQCLACLWHTENVDVILMYTCIWGIAVRFELYLITLLLDGPLSHTANHWEEPDYFIPFFYVTLVLFSAGHWFSYWNFIDL